MPLMNSSEPIQRRKYCRASGSTFKKFGFLFGSEKIIPAINRLVADADFRNIAERLSDG